jgi:hypothetical protein
MLQNETNTKLPNKRISGYWTKQESYFRNFVPAQLSWKETDLDNIKKYNLFEENKKSSI